MERLGRIRPRTWQEFRLALLRRRQPSNRLPKRFPCPMCAADKQRCNRTAPFVPTPWDSRSGKRTVCREYGHWRAILYSNVVSGSLSKHVVHYGLRRGLDEEDGLRWGRQHDRYGLFCHRTVRPCRLGIGTRRDAVLRLDHHRTSCENSLQRTDCRGVSDTHIRLLPTHGQFLQCRIEQSE